MAFPSEEKSGIEAVQERGESSAREGKEGGARSLKVGEEEIEGRNLIARLFKLHGEDENKVGKRREKFEKRAFSARKVLDIQKNQDSHMSDNGSYPGKEKGKSGILRRRGGKEIRILTLGKKLETEEGTNQRKEG